MLDQAGLVEATDSGTLLKIRLGKHAREIRAGNEEVEATA